MPIFRSHSSAEKVNQEADRPAKGMDKLRAVGGRLRKFASRPFLTKIGATGNELGADVADFQGSAGRRTAHKALPCGDTWPMLAGPTPVHASEQAVSHFPPSFLPEHETDEHSQGQSGFAKLLARIECPEWLMPTPGDLKSDRSFSLLPSKSAPLIAQEEEQMGVADFSTGGQGRAEPMPADSRSEADYDDMSVSDEQPFSFRRSTPRDGNNIVSFGCVNRPIRVQRTPNIVSQHAAIFDADYDCDDDNEDDDEDDDHQAYEPHSAADSGYFHLEQDDKPSMTPGNHRVSGMVGESVCHLTGCMGATSTSNPCSRTDANGIESSSARACSSRVVFRDLGDSHFVPVVF